MTGYSREKGGVETYIHNLCTQLDPDQFEVICSENEMEIDGKIWVQPENRHHYLKYLQFWKRFFRENHFDVMYYNTCDVVGIDMLIFAKSAGVPVRIIHAHSSGIQRISRDQLGFLRELSEKRNRRHLKKYATDLLACSAQSGRWMFGKQEFQIVKNGISVRNFKFQPEARQKLRTRFGMENNRLIGCVGRIAPVKNPEFVLSVGAAIKKRDPAVRILMIGDGELKKTIEEASIQRGLSDTILFTGSVNNVGEWMSALDCLLMPSYFEGLPFALIEAQAAGLPCVVSSNLSRETDLTGLVQFLDLKEGADVWAEQLLNCCGGPRPDTEEKLISAGYSIDNTASKVVEIITDRLDRSQDL